MECNNNVYFLSQIKIPPNLDFYNSNQFCISVNTDNLEVHSENIKHDIDSIKNPCDENLTVKAKTLLKQVKISGQLHYKISLNTSVSSYNFMIDPSLAMVVDSGWSSEEDSLYLYSVDDQGVRHPYAIVEYTSDVDQVITRDDIRVILTELEVKQIITDDFDGSKLVVIGGEFELLI